MRMEDPGSTTHFSRHPKTMKPKARVLNSLLFFFAITSVIIGITSVIFFSMPGMSRLVLLCLHRSAFYFAFHRAETCFISFAFLKCFEAIDLAWLTYTLSHKYDE